MQHNATPIHTPAGLRRVGLEQPPANLHLSAGWWTASCPVCGWLLAEGRRQDRVERKAARTRCPVCHEDAA